ncbi:hypothetical protein [Cognatishimia sp. F0-27]|uniref:hypothetical protein n=1 Tax=Cognatishimia sp. F0-27 TaxID=2816855 RepID=UPI001D0C2BA0|nr:hypothetical protein [Cognatishimia sp. F0-27]MCC1491563.1 hypothetical protein [Cognatishimia sp. F0-27]
MKLNFALSLSFDGIQFLRRMPKGWAILDEITLDPESLDEGMQRLKSRATGLHPNANRLGLIIPNAQIRYLSIPAPASDAPEVVTQAVEAALDGATPYAVSELVHDHEIAGGTMHVAAVARETLEEAEGFAKAHGFLPQAHLAIAPDNAFQGAVFFGAAEDWSGKPPERPRSAIVAIPADEAALTPTKLALEQAARSDAADQTAEDSADPADLEATGPEPQTEAQTPEAPTTAVPDAEPRGFTEAEGSLSEPSQTSGSDIAVQDPPGASPDRSDTGATAVGAGTGEQEEVSGLDDASGADASSKAQRGDSAAGPAHTGEPTSADFRPAETEPAATEPPATEAPATEAPAITADESEAPATEAPAITADESDPKASKPEEARIAGSALSEGAPVSGSEQKDKGDLPAPPAVDLAAARTSGGKTDETLAKEAFSALEEARGPKDAPNSERDGSALFVAETGAPETDLEETDISFEDVYEAVPDPLSAPVSPPEDGSAKTQGDDADNDARTEAKDAEEGTEAEQAIKPTFSTIRATREPGRDRAIPRAPRPFRLGAKPDETADKGTETTAGVTSGGIEPAAPKARKSLLERSGGLFSRGGTSQAKADPRAEAPPPPDRVPVSPPHPAHALRQKVAQARNLGRRTGPEEDKTGAQRSAPKDGPTVAKPIVATPKAPTVKTPLATAAGGDTKQPDALIAKASLRPGAADDSSSAAPSLTATGGAAAIASFVDDPDNERERMTVFGARGRDRVGGKPRFLGLMLTAGLLLFLAGVAAWASVFLDNGLARFFRSEPEVEAVAQLPDVRETAPVALSSPEETPEDATLDAVTEADGSGAAEEAEDTLIAALDEAADAMPNARPGLDARPGLAEPVQREALSPEQAAATYAATGIWQRAPAAPLNLPTGGVDDVYVASIDPDVQQFDAVALPQAVEIAPEAGLEDPGLPPPAGMLFDFDARGLVRATPEGALSPEGLRIYTGRPPVTPPLRQPQATPDPDGEDGADAGALGDPALRDKRPEARPSDLVEQYERAELQGISRSELAAFRPVMRPVTAQEEAARNAPQATEQAVVASLPPVTRPRNMQAIVERARARAEANPAPVQTASAVTAAAAPRVVQPRLPSSASVARSATVRNAINLNRISLIGVYGTQSNRRALVRMPNGRYVKVKVGDTLDGGRVQSINTSELRYRKGSRSLSLKMPRG